jgi:hypothetical protein
VGQIPGCRIIPGRSLVGDSGCARGPGLPGFSRPFNSANWLVQLFTLAPVRLGTSTSTTVIEGIASLKRSPGRVVSRGPGRVIGKGTRAKAHPFQGIEQMSDLSGCRTITSEAAFLGAPHRFRLPSRRCGVYFIIQIEEFKLESSIASTVFTMGPESPEKRANRIADENEKLVESLRAYLETKQVAEKSNGELAVKKLVLDRAFQVVGNRIGFNVACGNHNLRMTSNGMVVEPLASIK